MRIVALSCVVAVSLACTVSSATAALLVTVDKSKQSITVTRDGKVLHRWRVSTGRPSYGTPSGSFTAFRMEAEHFSKEWDDAPMPYSVFFTKQGHAIHGSYDTKRLGSPASHGCVRLAPANAATLFALVKQEGLSNTRVILTGSERVAIARAKAERAAKSLRQDVATTSSGSETVRLSAVGNADPRLRLYRVPQAQWSQSGGYQPPLYLDETDQ